MLLIERALIAVKTLDPSEAEYDAVQHAVGECQLCIASFLKKIEKYQSLTAGTTSLKDQIRKVKLGLYHEKDMKEFKETLDMQIQPLMLLMDKFVKRQGLMSQIETALLPVNQAQQTILVLHGR